MAPRAKRRMVFVHAHPDDEALSTGGTIARYAAENTHVCLITCTNGEVGEIAEVPDLGSMEDLRSRLGEVRRRELEEACAILGPVDLRMLGFHDSGMDGTPENDSPEAFVNQDIDLVVARIAEVLEELRPQVLVTYNEIGFYGHPDHIRAHEAALRAAARTHIAKIYYTAVPKSLMRMAREMAERIGLGTDEFFSDSDIERLGTDDSKVTTAIDVADFVDTKLDALKAHRTQLGTTQRFFEIPAEVRTMALGIEHYVLARSTVGDAAGTESDLFERIEA